MNTLDTLDTLDIQIYGGMIIIAKRFLKGWLSVLTT